MGVGPQTGHGMSFLNKVLMLTPERKRHVLVSAIFAQVLGALRRRAGECWRLGQWEESLGYHPLGGLCFGLVCPPHHLPGDPDLFQIVPTPHPPPPEPSASTACMLSIKVWTIQL